MITPIGKFLRKLRIDTGEILKDMAEKLHVSPAFLSAVENGKKKMPSTWNSTICILYQLSADQRAEFTKAIAATEESVTLDLTTFSFPQKEAAISFAREFPTFSDKELEALQIFLKRGDKHNV